MNRYRQITPRRRGQRLLAAAGALLALMALLGGIPIALYLLAGDPLRHLPQHMADIPDTLTRRVDDVGLVTGALMWIGWLGWASFAAAFLIEVVSQIAGWDRKILGLRVQQRLAGMLMAAILSSHTAPAVSSSSASVAVRPAAAVVTVHSTTATAPTTTAPADQSAGELPDPPRYITHQVGPREVLLDIAERYGVPAERIAAANHGVHQPDGGALHPGQTRIREGWQLRIPVADISTTHAAPAGAHAAHQPRIGQLTYHVVRGDWMSAVAARFLGDPDRYPEIAAANPQYAGRQASDGTLHYPDYIEAGWPLRLPAGAVDRGTTAHARGHITSPATKAPGDPAQHDPAGSAGNGQRHPSPRASTPTGPPPPTSVAAGPAPTASTSPSQQAHSAPPASAAPAPPATNGHQPAEDDSMLDQALLIGVPLLGAGLLAALTLGTLRRRRRRQEHHRPVGRRIPEPVNPQIETDLRVVAQPMAVERLDQALRALAAALVDRPAEQMPDIVGAWLDGDNVNLLLTAPCPNPPAPWTGDHLSWTLPAMAELPDVDGQLAPLPTLVAVGSQPGTHLLLDLERLGVLVITGDPTRVPDLLRYIAAELACNAWSDHVEVTIAGFDAAETSELLELGGDRIDAAPTIAAAVQRIRRRAAQVVQSLDHLGASDPLTGRIGDIAADAWMPHVLLANQPDAEEIMALEALDADLAATGRCAVAVAVTTHNGIGRWPTSIDAAGGLTVAFLGITGENGMLTAAGLPRAELNGLADLLATARAGTTQPGQVDPPEPVDAWAPVPPAPEPEPWARGTDAAGGLLPADRDDDHGSVDADDDVHDPTDDEAPADEPPGPPTTTAPATAHIPATEPARTGPTSIELPPAPPDDPKPREMSPRLPTLVALAGRQPSPRERVTAPVRRRHTDPTLDADLHAWSDAESSIPRIAILGPVTVDASGQPPPERPRFYAEIITYLAVRGQRGASTDQVEEALWPGQQVKATSRRVAITRARKWLGEASDGRPWLPDATTDRRYRLRDGYLLDWHLFRRLRSRGESRGPAGVGDLRRALSLVRGAPLAGADIAFSATARNPYTWLPNSEIAPHHLTAAIVDTAHRLAELCLEGGDVAGARWAVDQAWVADPDRASDIPWRDRLRVEAAEGHTDELEQLLADLIDRDSEAEVPEDLDKETYRLLCELMPERLRAGVR